MKKLLILALSLLVLTGCTNLKNSSYDAIIEETVSSRVKVANTYRSGYKFYLPRGMYVKDSKEYNEQIKNDRDTFYLFIDLIGFLGNQSIDKAPKGDEYYFKNISSGEKSGYIEVNLSSMGKYYVEIAYNYAKIEVMVEESRLKNTISEAMIILSSIDYNESYLQNISEESLLSYKEETVDIFNKENDGDNGNFLKYQGEYDNVDEDKIPDYDLIK